VNTLSTCEKDILALRLFGDNRRTGASRLLHDVTCAGCCIVTAILYLLVFINPVGFYWTAAFDRYLSCAIFRPNCTGKRTFACSVVLQWSGNKRGSEVLRECCRTKHCGFHLLRSGYYRTVIQLLFCIIHSRTVWQSALGRVTRVSLYLSTLSFIMELKWAVKREFSYVVHTILVLPERNFLVKQC
jgi:hypothetical protein